MIKNIFVVLVFLAVITLPAVIIEYFYASAPAENISESKSESGGESFFQRFFSFKIGMPETTSSGITPNPMLPTLTPDSRGKTSDSVETTPTPIPVDPNASPYKDKIKLTSVRGTSSAPESELVVIKNVGDKAVDITGFKIRNSNNEDVIIPKAFRLPGSDAIMRDDIILAPTKGTARINLGKQEKQMNFLENICMEYYTQNTDFGVSLSGSCPEPTFNYLDFSETCQKKLDSLSSCRMPTQTDLKNLYDDQCIQFINAHYNYSGCVKDFKSRADFYLSNWLVWMQRQTNFFKDYHEVVKLLDRENKVIAEYSY